MGKECEPLYEVFC